MDFFQNLNFSSSNEDGETELAALAGAGRILCLTGSGTRPLDLLMSDAEEIIALDVNPVQNALLALKVAAIETFERDEFLAFLGLLPSTTRGAAYDRLGDRLSPTVRTYWERHRALVEAGVWYGGKWERLLRWNARFLRLFRGKALDALVAAPDVEQQAGLWEQKFGDNRLRAVIELIGRDWIWRWIVREPGGAFLPPPRDVARRLASDFQRASRSFLFRDSDFAMLIFRGSHQASGALPVHLRPENYQRIRDRLSRLRVVEGGLADLGALDVGAIDGFSLSDFGSYCGTDLYASCWKGVLAAAASGAKFCERIFMNDMAIPFAGIDEDRALSEALSETDKAIIYRIRAGCISGKG